MEQGKPHIVVILGSSRDKDHHLGAAQKETLKGRIVLLAGFWHHVDRAPITADQKAALDDLAERKVDLADSVFLVNVHGYVGETTRRLLRYAKFVKKIPIESLELIDPSVWE